MIISNKEKKTRLHLLVHNFRNIFVVVVVVATVVVCWEKKNGYLLFLFIIIIIIIIIFNALLTMTMFSLINSLFVWFKDTESALPKESLPKMSAPKKLVFIFASFLCLFVYLFVCLFMLLGVLFEFLTTDHYQMIKPTSTHWIYIG